MASGVGHPADGGVDGLALARHPLDHPLEHAAVLAEARPQERAVVALAEPVDPEQLGQLVGVAVALDRGAPMSSQWSK